MKRFLKRLASCLPLPWQQHLKRIYYARQIRYGRFATDEKDYELLDSQVKDGDWVLDIGANIGHYTIKLSQLVGPEGRVFAFEPVPETFEILNSNVQNSSYKNITLLNVAVSDHHAMTNMDIPSFDTGLKNYFMAHLLILRLLMPYRRRCCECGLPLRGPRRSKQPPKAESTNYAFINLRINK